MDRSLGSIGGRSGIGKKGTEAVEVELALLEADRVPRSGRDDPVAEDPSQPRNLRLQRRKTATGDLEPELVEQTVSRNDAVRLQEQVRKKSSLPLSSERERLTICEHLDGTEA